MSLRDVLNGSTSLTHHRSISHESPIKSGSNEGLSLSEQELTVQKWSIFWRTTILSALGKTMYPYCRHLRMLDLRDLGYLLEDDKFRGKISKHFFSDDLARFHFAVNTPGKRQVARLDRNKIVFAIGDEITQHAPLLEALSEPSLLDTLSTALLTWAPRLSHLRSLDLFDGKALAHETLRNLLHAHCPNLERLKIYRSSSIEADHALATFISGMPEDRLVHFENIGDCGIGAETCLALNTHGKSLIEMKLSLGEEGILALGLLQECTTLHTLSISAERTSVDLKATQNDVYLQIVEWLKQCKNLKDVSFHNIASAPDLIVPVLLNQKVELEELDINANREEAMYAVKDHHDFHEALSHQRTLRRLHLRADPENITRDDIEKFMNALCSLKGLQELKLTRISDYFSDEHISLLGQHMPDLEELYIGGYGVSNNCFPAIAKLTKLKQVTFSGITNFTTNGIMNFVEQLGPGNSGFSLSVDNADPDSAISPEEQDILREFIQVNLDGRFDYQLLRGVYAQRSHESRYADTSYRPKRARIRFRGFGLSCISGSAKLGMTWGHCRPPAALLIFPRT